ncbi:hypothetical protein ARSEF1564_010284 [Beauveria bassiana]
MLRVIYQKPHNTRKLWDQFKSNKIVSAESRTKAETYLSTSTNFKEYLDALLDGRGCTSTFQMARLYQFRCARLKGEDAKTSIAKIDIPERRVTRSQARLKKQQQGSPTQKPSVATTIEDGLSGLVLGPDLPQTPRKPPPHPGGAGQPTAGPSPSSHNDDDNDNEDDTIVLSPFAWMGAASPLVPRLTDSSYQAIEDEQIVNFALSLLLDSLVEQCPHVDAREWTPTRSPFKVTDGQDEVYQARVDGVFQRRGAKLPDIVIEVKPHSRSKGGPAVDMQESAQVAA